MFNRTNRVAWVSETSDMASSSAIYGDDDPEEYDYSHRDLYNNGDINESFNYTTNEIIGENFQNAFWNTDLDINTSMYQDHADSTL